MSTCPSPSQGRRAGQGAHLLGALREVPRGSRALPGSLRACRDPAGERDWQSSAPGPWLPLRAPLDSGTAPRPHLAGSTFGPLALPALLDAGASPAFHAALSVGLASPSTPVPRLRRTHTPSGPTAWGRCPRDVSDCHSFGFPCNVFGRAQGSFFGVGAFPPGWTVATWGQSRQTPGGALQRAGHQPRVLWDVQGLHRPTLATQAGPGF